MWRIPDYNSEAVLRSSSSELWTLSNSIDYQGSVNSTPRERSCAPKFNESSSMTLILALEELMNQKCLIVLDRSADLFPLTSSCYVWIVYIT